MLLSEKSERGKGEGGGGRQPHQLTEFVPTPRAGSQHWTEPAAS